MKMADGKPIKNKQLSERKIKVKETKENQALVLKKLKSESKYQKTDNAVRASQSKDELKTSVLGKSKIELKNAKTTLLPKDTKQELKESKRIPMTAEDPGILKKKVSLPKSMITGLKKRDFKNKSKKGDNLYKKNIVKSLTNISGIKKSEHVKKTPETEDSISTIKNQKVTVAKTLETKDSTSNIKKQKVAVVQQNLPQHQEKQLQKRKAESTQESHVEEKKVKSDKYEFVPLPFSEERFNEVLTLDNIKNIAKALKQHAENQVNKKKVSIFSDYRYMLNVVCFKIPDCPKRMVKLNLAHSLVGKDDDIVMIVTDLKRGSRVDFTPTIQHYEDLLRENGLEYLKVMPFNQLKRECNTREMLRKFVNSYDYFLCDGRIVGHVNGFCGKILQKSRSTLHAVSLHEAKNIKSVIEKALKRTAYNTFGKGNMISMPVGNHRMTWKELSENVMEVIKQLKNAYPGGLMNIRKLTLNIDMQGASALPLYISMCEPPSETPNVIGKKEKRLLKLNKEANEILSKFKMTTIGGIVPLNNNGIKKKQERLQAETEAETNNLEKIEASKKMKNRKMKSQSDVAAELEMSASISGNSSDSTFEGEDNDIETEEEEEVNKVEGDDSEEDDDISDEGSDDEESD